MRSKLKLFIIILLPFVICGCNSYNVKTQTKKIDTWKEDLFKEDIVEKISATTHPNITYEYLSNKKYNEYSKKYKLLYEKIQYDNMSDLNKDIIDSLYMKIFWSNKNVSSLDIVKIYQIGYVPNEDTKLILIHVKCNNQDMYLEHLKTDNYNNATSYNTTSLFNQSYSINMKLNEETLEYHGDSNLIKKLNGKTLLLYDNDEVITKDVNDFLNFLLDTRKEIDSKNNQSDIECTKLTESEVKNKVSNSSTHSLNISSTKNEFHKVNLCNDTDIQINDKGSHYNIIIKGTCNGYTDSYDDDFNILYYTYEYNLIKSNCQINVINTKTKWKY